MSSVKHWLLTGQHSRMESWWAFLAFALVGSVLLWAALPPLALGWLGWIAPVPWLVLAQSRAWPRFGAYFALYLAYLAFWLATLHWLRLPHPALYLGWIALSAYLAVYLPVFMGITRIALFRLHLPIWVAAPIVWTGLELARAHLLTGFLMASFAHTQVEWTQLIQISDLGGEYAVDFLVMMAAAGIAAAVQRVSQQLQRPATTGPRDEAVRRLDWFTTPLHLAPATLLLAGALLYGHRRLEESRHVDHTSTGSVRIALIQGNSHAEWKADPANERRIMDEYMLLSDRAVEQANRDGQPIDLLVWPETMFRSGFVTFSPTFRMPPNVPKTKEEIAEIGPHDLASLTARLGVPVLVGIDRAHFDSGPLMPGSNFPHPRAYNSAVLVQVDGTIVGTYDKIHRVMFGEYIPFAEYLPFLYRITPLTGGIQAGEKPVVLEVDDHFYAPSICYETVIPHVMRRQAREEFGGSIPADVLINVTNDAWYHGSNELDQHLACGVFRAVETRRPLAIAANGGISAWIDRSGKVRAESPRQQPDIILADIELGSMNSWYVEFGDWFAGVCLTASVILAIIGWSQRRQPLPDPATT